MHFRKGGRDPHPHNLRLTEKWPVLLGADFVLAKDPKWPYEGQFGGKLGRDGAYSKAAEGP